jgi:hypothetical protein
MYFAPDRAHARSGGNLTIIHGRLIRAKGGGSNPGHAFRGRREAGEALVLAHPLGAARRTEVSAAARRAQRRGIGDPNAARKREADERRLRRPLATRDALPDRNVPRYSLGASTVSSDSARDAGSNIWRRNSSSFRMSSGSTAGASPSSSAPSTTSPSCSAPGSAVAA